MKAMSYSNTNGGRGQANFRGKNQNTQNWKTHTPKENFITQPEYEWGKNQFEQKFSDFFKTNAMEKDGLFLGNQLFRLLSQDMLKRNLSKQEIQEETRRQLGVYLMMMGNNK